MVANAGCLRLTLQPTLATLGHRPLSRRRDSLKRVVMVTW